MHLFPRAGLLTSLRSRTVGATILQTPHLVALFVPGFCRYATAKIISLQTVLFQQLP
jgi:hypothetical protein